MRAKVRNYKLIPEYYDSYDSSLGIFVRKEYTPTTLNVVFDENMYIKYPSDFNKELHELIVPKYRYKPIMQDTMDHIQFNINNLLEKYRNMKLLFLESDLFFRQKEGMIILHKDEYFDEY